MLYKYIYIYTQTRERTRKMKYIYLYTYICVAILCCPLGTEGKKKRCYFSAGVLWDKTDLRVKKSNLARRVFYWYFCNLWWACMTRLSPPCRNSPPLKKTDIRLRIMSTIFVPVSFMLQLGCVSASVLAVSFPPFYFFVLFSIVRHLRHDWPAFFGL